MEVQYKVKDRRRLDVRQRDFVANFLERVSLILFAALIVEPIVLAVIQDEERKQVFAWPLVVIVILVVLTIMTLAVKLKKT